VAAINSCKKEDRKYLNKSYMVLVRLHNSMTDYNINKKKKITDFSFHKCESCDNCKKIINKYNIPKVYYYY